MRGPAVLKPILALLVLAVVVLAVAVGASHRERARVTSVAGPAGCRVRVTGTPGTLSFTVHVDNRCPGHAVRAYCEYYNVSTGYGRRIGYGTGTSKATCSGLTRWGYQYRRDGAWTTVEMGRQGL